jgi:thioredoxin-related protein
MRKQIIIPLLFVTVSVLIAVTLSPAYARSQIIWRSYEDGKSLALSESKKIFLNFRADWCNYCRTMEKETFTNTDIVDFLNSNFVSIKIDVDRQKALARKYNIQPLPDSWFLTETGEVIGNRPGYLTPQDLLPLLRYIHSESYQKMSFSQFKESL